MPPSDPVAVSFVFFKTYLFLEILAVLALIRVVLGEGLARWPALVALIMAVGGLVALIAPAEGVSVGPFTIAAVQGTGMAALLVPAAVFSVSSVLPRARWRWMDAVHGVMLCLLLGLWWGMS